MNPEYSRPVATIVNDYMDRLREQVRTLPEPERSDLLLEMESHIHEAFGNEPGDDEVARILKVLRRLGEPSDVVSTRVPEAMLKVGKKRNMPLLVAGGVLVALFALPLGLGGLSVVLALVVSLLALVLAYFVTAGSFVLGGLCGSILSIIMMVNPSFMDQIAVALGIPPDEFFHVGVRMHPHLQGLVGLGVSVVLMAIGILMIWAGRKIPHGLRFLAERSWTAITNWARPKAAPAPAVPGPSAPNPGPIDSAPPPQA